MASYGHHVDSINGNTILRWKVDNNTAAKGIIAVSYIFVGFYGLTWAPCGWIYSSEVFPLRYRAQGVGLSAATNWIMNFAIAYFGTYARVQIPRAKSHQMAVRPLGPSPTLSVELQSVLLPVTERPERFGI
jgi:hypothetical protein